MATDAEKSLTIELVDEYDDDIERCEPPVQLHPSGNMLYVTFNNEEVTGEELRGKTFRIVVEEVT